MLLLVKQTENKRPSYLLERKDKTKLNSLLSQVAAGSRTVLAVGPGSDISFSLKAYVCS